MSINELFTTKNNEATTNSRMLSGTAELTEFSNEAATNIIRTMEANIDTYKDRIAKSSTSSKELDAIVSEFEHLYEISEDNLLRHLDDATVDSMLKSQQSKRSRTKNKTMTIDNYRAMLSAAIAEHILRTLYDKPKTTGGFGRRRSVDYTPLELEMFAEDQEALRKEIRNIQSKKSIMKSKSDFDESSEAWQRLLKAEVTLKDLRVGGRSSHVVEVDVTKDKLTEMLNGLDIEHLKAADSKELLAAIKSMALEQ